MKKTLLILGISGNIGQQAVEVLLEKKNYNLIGFSVGNNISVIPNLLKNFKKVKAICVKNKNDFYELKNKYKDIKFFVGDEGLLEIINFLKPNLVLNSLVGFLGMQPTLECIKNNINVALANKESLVVGGELINKALKNSKAKIYPVDSEHCAIYKCLKFVKKRDVKELIVTASGGAFRNLDRKDLKKVTREQALNHPTWKMGPRVTIDSATMMNKGFEVIEAYYLFKMPIKKIKILLHFESNVHSIVSLKNGLYLGEVNKPSMKNPIAFALSNHRNVNDVFKVNKIEDFGKEFHFKEFDIKRYPMVKFALKAIRQKGIMPCVLNAADEIAVNAFLEGKIKFLEIEKVVSHTLKSFNNIKKIDLKTIINYDIKARECALKYIEEGLN